MYGAIAPQSLNSGALCKHEATARNRRVVASRGFRARARVKALALSPRPAEYIQGQSAIGTEPAGGGMTARFY